MKYNKIFIHTITIDNYKTSQILQFIKILTITFKLRI
jgi:hypothetical protein